MYKVTLILLALALFLSGCCTKQLPNGTTTKNPLNCVTKAVDILCNPSAEQQEQARRAAEFLDEAAQYAPVLVRNMYFYAKQIFLNVRPDLCVGLDRLAEAIAQFDAARKRVLEQSTVLHVSEQGEIYYSPPVAIPDIGTLRKAVTIK